MKVKLLLTFALLLTAVTGAWALEPQNDDVWDEATKTLTVNSNPAGFYSGNGEIQHLVIASGVTSIGDGAFFSCPNLTSVIIPASVTSIGNSAFDGCTSLTTVSIPASVTSVGLNAFENTPWLEGQPDGVVYVGKVAYKWKGEAAIAAITDGTVSISPEAFKGCLNLTSVIIPASVTSIGDFAFYHCQNLASVIVYATTPPTLGFNVFEGNAVNRKIYVPNGTEGGYKAAAGWKNYAGFIMVIPIKPEESGTCGNGVTWELIKLTANSNNYILTISGTGDMESNPWEWESYKNNITTVVIGNGVTSIIESAFNGCTSLATVSIPASVTSIGDYAFNGCASLTTVSIPDGVTSIGGSAFNGCTSLTTVSIPASVTSVGSSAFENTPWLGYQPNGVVYVGKVAYKWKGDATIATIADGTVSISPWAFSSAQITSVSIPASVTSIGYNAFNGCPNLTSVIIPASVTSIGNFAFQSCTKLEYVYVLPTTPPTIGYDPFNACNALTAIVVPAAAYETYYYDDVKGWNSYQSKLKETSGNCGTTDHESDVTWLVKGGILTISGTGQMMYYGSALGGDSKYHSTAPWSYLDSEIQKVIVEDGVTYIGSYAFAYCTALTSVSLPASVIALGDYVCYSSNVTRIDIPGTTAATIGTGGFDACPADLQIAVPSTLLGTYQIAGNWSAYAAKLVGVLNETTGFDNNFATGNYEYTRTFKCGIASTVCLPFSVTAAQAASVGKFYTFDGIDKTGEKWEVIMKETNTVSTDLSANTPYLFMPYIFDGMSQGDAMPLIFTGEVATAANAGYTSKAEGTAGAYWTFQGVYYNVAWNDGNANLGSVYGFAAQNYDGSSYTVNPGDFVKAMAGASIAPFRAFLQYTPAPSNAPRRGAAEEALPSRMSVRLVNADGDVTAIGTIDTKTGEIRFDSEAWYTLDGRRLDSKPAQKGVYINNGKKIIVK